VKDVATHLGVEWLVRGLFGEQTVAQALEIMRNNRIISLPILKSNGLDFDGIVDVLDLITLCATKFGTVSLLAEESYRQMEEFANKPVKDLLDISGRNQWIFVSYKDPLSKLLHLLSTKHRVAVIDESNAFVGLITQSKFVEFISKNPGMFKQEFNKKVQNLQKPVESINMKEFVIEAFKRIWDKQVTGLAVVNDDGTLVANISASDLFRVHAKPIGELIHDLYQPLKTFLNIRADIKDQIMMAELPACEPISVTAVDTLGTTIQKCLEHKVHRVFIQDDKFKPVGVISLGDIIQQFV
jgi:CBS domain-containing protein